MAMQLQKPAPVAPTGVSESTVAAFGASAVVTVVFNVMLAFIKDAYAPLNSVMAHLTGHHWITHGLADLLVFVMLGALFTAWRVPARGLTQGLVITLSVAVTVAGVALGGWYLLF